jgi:N-acyl-D-aspartate/D-glutamate deacylase
MVLLNFDEDRVGELLRQPESLIALSDAGAHVSVLCDAGYATHLLGHWVRERQLFGWEEAIRRLTRMPADIYGISGRGRIEAGAVADLVCFDPARVAMLPPERRRDLPGGAERYICRSQGIERVFVAGREILVDGEWTGATPGVLLSPGEPTASGRM